MKLLFKDLKEEDQDNAIQSVIRESTPSPSFFFLMKMSTLMATIGLLMNNASVIIGSMLIAPLLSPLLSLSLAISMRERFVLKRSLHTIMRAFFSSILFSTLTSFLLFHFTKSSISITKDLLNSEIISRISPNILFFFIALIAGATTAFARMKPELNDTLPGTAIAIALVPPLSAIGIGISFLEKKIIIGSLSLFIVNVIGILLGALLIFSQLNLRKKKKIAHSIAKRADSELNKMIEKHEEEQLEKTIKEIAKEIGIEKIKKEK